MSSPSGASCGVLKWLERTLKKITASRLPTFLIPICITKAPYAMSAPIVEHGNDNMYREGRAYYVARSLARFALWAYFRNCHVSALGNVPTNSPMLVAANHLNMVLDPAVLIVTSKKKIYKRIINYSLLYCSLIVYIVPHSRQLHFWALARFFKIPVIGRIFAAVGVLPVDTKTRSNAKLFESTINCMGQDQAVAVFPEGDYYTISIARGSNC